MDAAGFGAENGRSPGAGGGNEPHRHGADEWAELLARTVAHLAAQLTMTQVRLRALATELAERGGVDPTAVQDRLRGIAAAETGSYLRGNLGEALNEVIDVDALEADIIAFLSAEEPTGA